MRDEHLSGTAVFVRVEKGSIPDIQFLKRNLARSEEVAFPIGYHEQIDTIFIQGSQIEQQHTQFRKIPLPLRLFADILEKAFDIGGRDENLPLDDRR